MGALVLAVLLTVGSAIAVSYGLARDDRVWLLVGAAVFAPVLVASVHGAARAVTENRRAAGGAAGAGLAFLFVIVVVVAEPWWCHERAAPHPALVLAASDPSAHVYLRGTPGGRELSRRKDPAPLVASTPYRFDCEVELSDGTRWLRLADSSDWAPANVLLTSSGGPAPAFPRC